MRPLGIIIRLHHIPMVKTIVFANIIILSFFLSSQTKFVGFSWNLAEMYPNMTLLHWARFSDFDPLFKVTDLFLCKNCKNSSGLNVVSCGSILIILNRNGLQVDAILLSNFGRPWPTCSGQTGHRSKICCHRFGQNRQMQKYSSGATRWVLLRTRSDRTLVKID